MTEEFLAFSKLAGQRPLDPSSRVGLRRPEPGDQWCVCASRWLEAYRAGVAAPVVLGATHERALEVVPIDALTAHVATGSSSAILSDIKLGGQTPMLSEWPLALPSVDARGVIETDAVAPRAVGRQPLRALRAFHARPGRDPLHPRRAARPYGALEQHERSLEEWEAYGFGKRAIIEAGPIAGSASSSSRSSGRARGRVTTTWRSGTSSRPDRWRQGIATEAALATRDEAFERCGLAGADRPLPGRERRLGACARQGRLRAAAAVRARRRDHRRDPPPAAGHWRAAGRQRAGRCREGGHVTGAEYRETG